MEGDARGTRVDEDGVRVFESGRARRVARTRFVVVAFVGLAIAVVVLSTTTLVILRRDHAAERTLDASALQGENRVATRPVPPAAPRARPDPRSDQGENPAPPTHVARISRPATGTASSDTPAGKGDLRAEAATERAPVPNPAPAEREEPQLHQLARDVIEGLKASGETSGIAAFPPPGTKPAKVGLVVPDNFALPEGYVRYYQITDEGRRLEPILMFSPDYRFVDGEGRPIALPEDGIVPPDMAPPGLPVRMLQLPHAAHGAGR